MFHLGVEPIVPNPTRRNCHHPIPFPPGRRTSVWLVGPPIPISGDVLVDMWERSERSWTKDQRAGPVPWRC